MMACVLGEITLGMRSVTALIPVFIRAISGDLRCDRCRRAAVSWRLRNAIPAALPHLSANGTFAAFQLARNQQIQGRTGALIFFRCNGALMQLHLQPE